MNKQQKKQYVKELAPKILLAMIKSPRKWGGDDVMMFDYVKGAFGAAEECVRQCERVDKYYE